MSRGREHKDSIPIDLVLEIFSRLPSKSISRFRCVSKLLGSILGRPYFTELFLTRSRSRPRVLFAVQGTNSQLGIYSSPQSQKSTSTIVVTADFHMKFQVQEKDKWFERAVFPGITTSGLIYFSDMHVICNPITGQYASLPKLKWDTETEEWTSFLGFDPIDKQFKVLSLDIISSFADGCRILTLAAGGEWRKVQSPIAHNSWSEWICINGVLYYLANRIEEQHSFVIVCFDVRSEKFKYVDAKFICDPHMTRLINYKGKLAGTHRMCHYRGRKGNIELLLWVLEDVEKQEWSKHVYTLCDDKFAGFNSVCVDGVTVTGEIVLSTGYTGVGP